MLRQNATGEADVNTLELTITDGHPLDAVAAALDALGVTEDRVVTAQIAVTYETEVETVEPVIETNGQDDSEDVELDINAVETCSISYGSQAYAILKHLEDVTDGNEWATTREIAERLGDGEKTTAVSAQVSKWNEQNLVERAPRDDIPQKSYKYKITLLGREALRRSEHEEETRQPVV